MGETIDVEWINFPIPLDRGGVARVNIPTDITRGEAEHIARIVMALAPLPDNEKLAPSVKTDGQN